MAELEARRLWYILGVRERTDRLVRELVLTDPAPFVPLMMRKRGKEIDSEAKTLPLAGRRYSAASSAATIRRRSYWPII